MPRMRSGWPVTVLALLATSAVPVAAQQPTEIAAGHIERPVQIGVGVGGVTSFVGNGGDVRVTVSVPLGERRSIDGFVAAYRGDAIENFVTTGTYRFQITQPIDRGRRPGFQFFATFGLMGIFGRAEAYKCSNGSCQPYLNTTKVLPPLLGLAGVGVQYTVTPRLAVRVESQAAIFLIIPVGIRVSAGVSIPLGHVFSDSR